MQNSYCNLHNILSKNDCIINLSDDNKLNVSSITQSKAGSFLHGNWVEL